MSAGREAAQAVTAVSPKSRDKQKTEEALEAAFLKLKNQGKKVTAQAVAEAVGVHPSLIPKAYGRVHQLILKARGKASAQKLDAKTHELAEMKRVLDETRQAKELSEEQLKDLVSVNLTLEQTIKEAPDPTQLRAVETERDTLAVENQLLKGRVAELEAQLQGKLVGRIGGSRPPRNRESEKSAGNQ